MRYTKTNKVNKQIFNIPYQIVNLTYTGSLQSPSWSNYEPSFMTVSGDTSGVNAGTYSVTFSLTDKENYLWSNYTSDDVTVTWVIQEATIYYVPSQGGTLSYSGTSVSPVWNNYNSSQMTIGGTTSAIDAGAYAATFTPNANYKWNDGSKTTKIVTWKIDRAIIQVPTQSDDLIYTGESITPIWNNYSSETMTWTGDTSGIDVGTYTAIFTPKSNYKWLDGTTGSKNVTWEIKSEPVPEPPTWSTNSYLPVNCDSIAYGNGVYVAIQSNGSNILYSTDLNTWKYCTFSLNNNPIYGISGHCVAFGNGKFVVMNLERGEIYYSNNGINFYNCNIQNNTQYSYCTFKAMAYGDGAFYAVGFTDVASESGVYAISVGGQDWFIEELLPITKYHNDWVDIAYGDNKFIAVDENSNSTLVFTGQHEYHDEPFPNNISNARIAYGDGKFVVLGIVNNNVTALYKEDGDRYWTVGEVNGSRLYHGPIAYGNGMFVSIGGAKTLYSVDGKEWFETDNENLSSAAQNQFTDITYGNNKFVAIGPYSGLIYTS